MGAMASQITSPKIVYSTVYSGTDNTKASRHWPLSEFPAQRASNAENVSIWWRHLENREMALRNSVLNPWYLRMYNFKRFCQDIWSIYHIFHELYWID